MKTFLSILTLSLSCLAQTAQQVDSIFDAMHADSLRVADSLRAIVITSSTKRPTHSLVQPADTGAPNIAGQKWILDSLAAIVGADSTIEHRAAHDFFRKQPVATLSQKLECIDSLLAHKLRTKREAARYLICEKILCADRQVLYYHAIKILPAYQKSACKNRMDAEMRNCAAVQAKIEKLEDIK